MSKYLIALLFVFFIQFFFAQISEKVQFEYTSFTVTYNENKEQKSKQSEIKKGFNFVSLTKGDTIKNEDGDIHVVKSVGFRCATIENKKSNKTFDISSLKGYEPVKIKNID